MPLNPSALSGGLKVGSAGKNRVGEGGLGVDSELSRRRTVRLSVMNIFTYVQTLCENNFRVIICMVISLMEPRP